jgi:site-specific recombinase XerD
MEGDLIVDPTGKNYPYAKLFDVLKSGLKDNSYYKVIVKDKVKKLYQFVYSKDMQKKLGVTETLVKFRKQLNLKDIALLELVYSDGKKVKLTFEKVDTKIKFPKDYFYFKQKKKN